MTYSIYWPAKKKWFPVVAETQKDALICFKRMHKLLRLPMGYIVRKGDMR